MKFKDMQSNNWNMAITGFIGGFVVYFMSELSKTIESKILLGILTFFIMILLVEAYTFFMWCFNKNKN